LSFCDLDQEDVLKACKKCLKVTGLTYLDGYLFHWPTQWSRESSRVPEEKPVGGKFQYEVVHKGDRTAIAATYAAMEELVKQDLVLYLGVSNFSSRLLGDLMTDCQILPQICEFERQPYLQQKKLLSLCSSRGVRVIANSPLGKAGSCGPNEPNLLHDSCVLEIAKECDRTAAQVLLRWNVQCGNVTVVPKSIQAERIQQNADICGWALTSEQMQKLELLDRGHRFLQVDWWDFKEDEVENKLAQPTLLPGIEIQTGTYVNAFYRENKPLCSTIIIERGCVENMEQRALDFIPKKCHAAHNYIVTDEIVDALYGEVVLFGMRKAGLTVDKFVMPANEMDEAGEPSCETYKTLTVFSTLCDKILAKGISKHSCIISLGGGVVNNMCGFIASSLYRGITLVHITTSMMGMTDAAIDFKQAVNHMRGKNLIGAYYPASTIIIDPETLRSLSKRHIVNGLSEALKHGLAQSIDVVKEIVDPVRENGRETFHDSAYLESVCRTCIDYKVPTLIHYEESDFNEMVPQYGHAVGHAVEHLSFHTEGVQPLLHGEAVAIGMCITAEVAYLLGICTEEVVDQHYDFISAIYLPVCVPEQMTPAAIMRKMMYDKHYVKKPTIGMAIEIGNMYCKDGSYGHAVDEHIILQAIQANIKRRMSNADMYPSKTPL